MQLHSKFKFKPTTEEAPACPPKKPAAKKKAAKTEASQEDS